MANATRDLFGKRNGGPHFKLDNLIAIIDRNSYQQTGAGSDIMNSGDLRQKLITLVGMLWILMAMILVIFTALNQYAGGKPKAIVAKTIKGRGFLFRREIMLGIMRY